ncbi:hypothetical protein F5890DRAFT_1633379 [Lentinula detonsa]|uniref:Uncharacterized protein n=1 Tax=Lentinula detonsa TaxID=2804962 RepID=A0AA38Q539_9AGAR|nr:hypothetical protein F5890DRAFT_1633379 [Lentinula detonsa]
MADAWSFNLRNNLESDFDSEESDSDFENTNTTSNTAFVFDETTQINDLDLSNREETVLYKPNPFSIAKINAASRARKFTASAQKSQQKPILTPEDARVTTIIDCFRNQAKKPQLIGPPTITGTAIDSSAPVLPKSANDSSHSSLNTRTPSTEHCASTLPNARPDKNSHDSYERPVAHIVNRLPPIFRTQPCRRHPLTSSSPIRPPAQFNAVNTSPSWNRCFASSPAAPSHQPNLHATSAYSASYAQRLRPLSPQHNSLSSAHGQFCATPFNCAVLTPKYANSPQDNIPMQTCDAVSPYRLLPSQQAVSTPYATLPARPEVTNRTPNPDRNSDQKVAKRSPPSVPKARPRKSISPTRMSFENSRNNSHKPDPYNSLPIHDEEWGTLKPARKKTKRENEGIRRTSQFTLGGMNLGKGKKTGMPAESSRRVITFLPPPLGLKSQTLLRNNDTGVPEVTGTSCTSMGDHENDNCNPSTSSDHSGGDQRTPNPSSPARKASNPYPSPHASSTLIMSHSPGIIIDHSAAKAHHIVTPYRPPSPPTSDPPQQFGSEEAVLLDMKDISRRYPKTRSMIRKRRHDSQSFIAHLDPLTHGIVLWPWE